MKNDAMEQEGSRPSVEPVTTGEAARGREESHIKMLLKEHWTLICGLVFVSFGFFLLLEFKPESLAQKLGIGIPIEVGFAFIIAWVVGMTVEREARRELSDHANKQAVTISENVVKYLYSVDLPRDVFDLVEEYVFKQKVIKTSQLLVFDLTSEIIEGDWIAMNCEFDYRIKNISSEDVDYPVRFHASKVSGLNEPKVGDVGLKSLIIGSEEIEEAEFQDIDDADEDNVGQQKFSKNVTLRPGEEKRIRVNFSQYKRVNDNDLFQTNAISLCTELRVHYNAEMMNLFWEPVHPSEKFDREMNRQAGTKNACKIAEIDSPLLPKHGIFIWWNKIPAREETPPGEIHYPEVQGK